MVLRFEDIEKDLQTGDIILFYTPFNWRKPLTYIAAAIRFFADVKYNHSAVYIKNWGIGFINEAIERGVLPEIAEHRLRGVQVLIKRRKSKYVIPEKDIAIKANSILGYTKYDFLGTLWYQLIYQLNRKKRWVGPTSREECMKRMYCYEYVAWVHEDIYPDWWKVDLKKVIDSDKTFTYYDGTII